MNKKYDLAIYIGRFQPFHVAHQKTIEHGLEIADNVLVLVGSANGPRTIKNPWTYAERATMIQNSFPSTQSNVNHVHIEPLRDFTYNDNAWIEEVDQTVKKVSRHFNAKKLAILGNDKDNSSFYLNYFPQWTFVEEPLYPPHGDSIDATKIRRLMFENDAEFIKGVVPAPVYEYMINGVQARRCGFIYSEEFQLLKKEWNYVKEYKKSWANSPHAPIFTTVDGVVIQSGHILLIQRGEFPGNGLWALPGGFINENERIRTAVLRELREETGLKIPVKVLDRAIDATELFDDPLRSTRGRTITHAFRITLDPTQSLPKVKGGDDARHAEWIPLGEIDGMENVMYEDHFHIIKHMLAQPIKMGS